jgi:hypothetical protein
MFVKQPANQGQVVSVGPRTMLRDRDEAALAVALSLALELSRSEGQMLSRMLARDCSTETELHIAANCRNEEVSLRTMRVLLSRLRKRLTDHDIEITRLRGLGYGLGKPAREKIYRRLAEYDALVPLPPKGRTRQQAAAPPKRRARADQSELLAE